MPAAAEDADASTSRTPESQRMVHLMLEYEKEDESLEDPTMSTSQGALMLSLHTELEDRDVLDRGLVRLPGVSRYALEPDLLTRVDRIAGELQYFLQRGSALVPGRTRYFRVDPEDSIIPVLKGCSNVAQLVVAWGILRKRLHLGREFIQKYAREFRNPDSIEDYSPASTTKELTEEMRKMPSDEARMRFMIAYYPHHNEQLSTHRERLDVITADWDTVAKLAQGEENREDVTHGLQEHDDNYQTHGQFNSVLYLGADEEHRPTSPDDRSRSVSYGYARNTFFGSASVRCKGGTRAAAGYTFGQTPSLRRSRSPLAESGIAASNSSDTVQSNPYSSYRRVRGSSEWREMAEGEMVLDLHLIQGAGALADLIRPALLGEEEVMEAATEAVEDMAVAEVEEEDSAVVELEEEDSAVAELEEEDLVPKVSKVHPVLLDHQEEEEASLSFSPFFLPPCPYPP
ncbi:hypothetical protein B0H13DRAFT_2333316 [Mycena leptocephala]|nr:hypothetical protein B0H13DRAFT_2333316 [Mycena leptocephala]